MMSRMPAATASSTMSWIDGTSTMGSISLGMALEAGRLRVPRPAAGITALSASPISRSPRLRKVESARDRVVQRLRDLVVGIESRKRPRRARIHDDGSALDPRQVEQARTDKTRTARDDARCRHGGTLVTQRHRLPLARHHAIGAERPQKRPSAQKLTMQAAPLGAVAWVSLLLLALALDLGPAHAQPAAERAPLPDQIQKRHRDHDQGRPEQKLARQQAH